MMRVLVTGATGFIGAKLVDFLSLSGDYEVVALVRSDKDRHARENVDYIVGDLMQISDWQDVLSDIDIVVHSAGRAHIMNDQSDDPLAEFRALNTDATLKLAHVSSSYGIKRFIYLSTLKVLGEYTERGKAFSFDSRFDPVDSYAVSKFEAEVGLRELTKNQSLETVIIRPPLVYGAGVKGNFKRLLNLVKWPIPLPFGAIYNSRSMVSVENLVDLIGTCLWHPNAANSIFLVSDGQDLSTTDLISLIAKTGGYNIKNIKVPLILLKFTLLCAGKIGFYDRLCRSSVVDCEHTKTQLDWRPGHNIEDSIKSCWADFK
jgi:nucleoside-diphosphate-sugar epimerase